MADSSAEASAGSPASAPALDGPALADASGAAAPAAERGGAQPPQAVPDLRDFCDETTFAEALLALAADILQPDPARRPSVAQVASYLDGVRKLSVEEQADVLDDDHEYDGDQDSNGAPSLTPSHTASPLR